MNEENSNNNSDLIKNALKEKYGVDCIVNENDLTYEIIIPSDKTISPDKLIIPKDYNDNMKLIGCVSGAGGGDGAIPKNLINELSANPNSNVILSVGMNPLNNRNVLEVAGVVADALDIKIDDVICDGFSMGSPYAIKYSDEFLEDHPDVNMQVIYNDGGTAYCKDSGMILDLNSLNNLREKGVPIGIAYGSPGQNGMHDEFISKLTENGYNTYAIQYGVPWNINGVPGHPESNILIEKDYLLYAIGEKDELSLSLNGSKFDLHIYKDFNLVTGFKAEINGNEISACDLRKLIFSSKNNFFDIQDLVVNNIIENSDYYIKNDIEFIVNSMNEIRSKIKDKSHIFEESYETGSSTLANQVSAYIQNSMNVTKKSFETILTDTELTAKTAQAIVDMDNSLATKIVELGN